MSARRLAFCSPLPPAHSGIADYSGDLLPHLAPHFDEIHLFVPAAASVAGELSRRFPVSPLNRLGRWPAGEAILYQIGNAARFHGEIYRAAEQRPGVVVLHEYMLQHLIRGLTIDERRIDDYTRLMGEIYGEPGERAARSLLHTGAARGLWRFPLFEPLVDASHGVLVHSHSARRRILESRPDAAVEVVPHLLLRGAESLAGSPRQEVRQALGIPDSELAVASFGLLTETKRLDVVLAAFARLRRHHPQARYYLVGDASRLRGLDSLLRGELGEGVALLGRTPLERFTQYTRAADIAVNLRHPDGGETSGTALRLLQAGTPLIVTDAGWLAEIPDAAAVKVAVDDHEEDNLLAALLTLADEPDLRRRMGTNARRWAETHHAPGAAAARYAECIEELARRAPRQVPTLRQRGAAARPGVWQRLIEETGEALFDLGVGEDEDELLATTAALVRQLCPQAAAAPPPGKGAGPRRDG